MTLPWLLGIGAVVLLAMLGQLVHEVKRAADAAENMAAQLAYLESLLTSLAADVDALRQLKTQESEFPVMDPDPPGSDETH